MRTLILLPFLLLTFSLFAQKKSADPDILSKVTKEQYSLIYPKFWTLDTSKMFGMDILLRSPKTDSLDDFSENMNVFVQNLHGQNYDLLRMGQESEAQIKKMVTDVEIIDSRVDSTALQQYYSLRYKGRQGKFLLLTIQRYYFKNDIGYALTFTIKDGKENEYIPIADKIFNSFQLRQ